MHGFAAVPTLLQLAFAPAHAHAGGSPRRQVADGPCGGKQGRCRQAGRQANRPTCGWAGGWAGGREVKRPCLLALPESMLTCQASSPTGGLFLPSPPTGPNPPPWKRAVIPRTASGLAPAPCPPPVGKLAPSKVSAPVLFPVGFLYTLRAVPPPFQASLTGQVAIPLIRLVPNQLGALVGDRLLKGRAGSGRGSGWSRGGKMRKRRRDAAHSGHGALCLFGRASLLLLLPCYQADHIPNQQGGSCVEGSMGRSSGNAAAATVGRAWPCGRAAAAPSDHSPGRSALPGPASRGPGLARRAQARVPPPQGPAGGAPPRGARPGLPWPLEQRTSLPACWHLACR